MIHSLRATEASRTPHIRSYLESIRQNTANRIERCAWTSPDSAPGRLFGSPVLIFFLCGSASADWITGGYPPANAPQRLLLFTHCSKNFRDHAPTGFGLVPCELKRENSSDTSAP